MNRPDPTGPHEVLGALNGARPAAAVIDRIVAGALDRAPRRAGFLPASPAPGWIAAAALAAALIAAAAWLARPTAPAGDVLAIGAHRVTRAEAAEVEVARRTTDDTLVRVEGGEARFEVAPLAAGEAFRVHTPELEVEVVGTVFSVASAEGCSTVRVDEGRVRVTADAASRLLVAGESMRHCPRGVEREAPGEALIREAQRALLDPGGAGRAVTLFERYAADHPDGVFLEEALFHLAFAHRARGDEPAAAAAAARFVERFPAGRRADRVRAAFGAEGR